LHGPGTHVVEGVESDQYDCRDGTKPTEYPHNPIVYDRANSTWVPVQLVELDW